MSEKKYLNQIFDTENIEEDDTPQGMLDFLNEDIPQDLHENIMKSVEKENSKKHFNYKVFMPLIAASLVVVVSLGVYRNIFKQTKSECAKKPEVMNIAVNDSSKGKSETPRAFTIQGDTASNKGAKDASQERSIASSNVKSDEKDTSTVNGSTKYSDGLASKIETKDTKNIEIEKKDSESIYSKSLTTAVKSDINYEIKLDKEKDGDILKFIQEKGKIINEDIYSFDLEIYRELEKILNDNNVFYKIKNEINNNKVKIKIINEWGET